MASTCSPHTIRYGFSGFGVRNSVLVKSMVVALLAERELVKGLNLRLDFRIFEANPDSEEGAGVGYAFYTNCEATVNSDVSGKIRPLTHAERIPTEHQRIVSIANNLADNVAKNVESNLPRYEAEFRERNPAAFALLKETTDKDGKVDTTRAFSTRGLIGKIQGDGIREILQFAKNELADVIQIKVYYGHTVIGADFSTPSQPKLHVRNDGDESEQWHDFDFVQLANGTTGIVPVSDDVATKAFSGVPNLDSVRLFLDKHGVMDSTTGQVKPGASIGITGTRLSAYDNIPLILKLTKMLVVTDDGWRLDEKEAAKYQGLLTFISHHEGDVAPPRHNHTINWPGKSSFLRTPEMHPIMLQKEFDWLSFVLTILKANIAVETGTVPSRVNRPMSTAERMADYHRQSFEYRRNPGNTTEVQLLRAGQLAMIAGFGFESDPEGADRELVARAPLTREDRAGYPYRYSTAYDITLPARARDPSQGYNMEFFRYWRSMWNHISASPIVIQDMISQLFSLGVARFIRGSFQDIKLDSYGQRVSIRGDDDNDHTFDVLFAPKVLTPTADVLLQSLRGKVREMTPGVPDYAKGRFMVSSDNKRMIHAMDVGSGAHGTTEILPQGRAVIGLQFADTNDHLSASEWAGTASRLVLLLSALKAKGDDMTVHTLLDTYKKTLPSQAEYDAETMSFQDEWYEVNQRRCFLKALEWAFPGDEETMDPVSYAECAKQCAHANARVDCIAELEKKKPGVEAVFSEELGKILDFNPISRDHFFLRRYIHFTPVEIERVWNRLFMAV